MSPEANPARGALLARAPSGGLVVGAIASVQFGSSLAATLFERLGPGGTVSLRLSSAAVVLLVLVRPRLRGRTKQELLLAATFGLVLAAMNLSFYEAIARIPLGVAVAIEFIGPLAVAVAGSRSRLDLVWIALAGVGILVLTRGATRALDETGIELALTAGCLWGAYILLNARLGQAFEGSSGLTLALCVGAIVALPVGISAGGSHLLEPASLVLGAAVGILSSAIPYSFEVEALRRLTPSVFGVLMSLEPAMAALAGFVVLGQGLGARELLGIAFVIAASIGASRATVEAPLAL